ncbi:hypothetical protein DAPPUDRAFT_314811 [Daphnia pulex]|uniref:Chromo domain-containing protein n=1 Tax=Daphnia pulex TaxID=6669 RepID=E9G7J8_DAPPU|nr:hypothetical protein DAPPUDRAFT_314811 [Daphnia pulex]|eukprot:EFX84478.1 hypothetical protein DAPPUDRAFT_314811 [Daphnia pulex]
MGLCPKRRPWYLIKWTGHEETSWTFYRDVRDGCPKLLSTFLKDFKKSNRVPVELVVTHQFTEEPEESDEDLANEVVEPPSLQNVNSSPASSSLCYGQHCSPASSSHCYGQQSSPAPSSHCDGQHSSPASSLHLHYSESINGEGDELENCENSPCQQSSPTPSFQISEAGSAEFSEDESDERQLYFVHTLSTVNPAWVPVVEEKGKKRVRCINCKK